MTTEDDFQSSLDRCPDDWQTRMILADFLEERGDVRAEGYRALGANRIAPVRGDRGNGWWVGNGANYILYEAQRRSGWWHYRGSLVADDWFAWIAHGELVLNVWRKFETRREADGAAALAFSQLPPERRAELLAGAEIAANVVDGGR